MVHIAYFGTPEFAADILQDLNKFCVDAGHSLDFIVCQPDRPAHRGMKATASPVKEFAVAHNIMVYQPSTLKKGSPEGDDFFGIMSECQPDICIVAAYGKIIPPRFLALPRFGYINVHASLLPRWRGASPIHHAVLHGDSETGISIIQLITELDAGPIFSTRSIEIGPEQSSGELTKALATLGGKLLVDTLPKIFNGTLVSRSQPSVDITYAPLLTKEDGLIVWQKSNEHVRRQVFAMQPWPRAYSFYQGKRIFFFDCRCVEQVDKDATPGQVIAIGNELVVATASGAVSFSEVQAEGKKRMYVDQFVKGCAITVGCSFDDTI